jgi:hypothetical protein
MRHGHGRVTVSTLATRDSLAAAADCISPCAIRTRIYAASNTVKLAPSMPVARSGLPPSFVLSAAAWIPPFRVGGHLLGGSTAMRATYVALLHGSSLRSRLCCPGPSPLSRPDPPHSRAQPNFIALRLIWAAFAVRERLGDPRVVPCFCRSILPNMSSSTSPGSRSLHVSSSFATRTGLHREPTGSALPMLGDVGAYWFTIVTTC